MFAPSDGIPSTLARFLQKSIQPLPDYLGDNNAPNPISSNGINLCVQMLSTDPLARPSGCDLSSHPFFNEHPFPCDSSVLKLLLNTIEQSNSYYDYDDDDIYEFSLDENDTPLDIDFLYYD